MTNKTNNKKIKLEIKQLQDKISLWDKHYYDLDNPVVSDEIYDIEFNKLKKLEQEYSSLFSNEELELSPTNRINAHAAKIFKRVSHEHSMLSLNKAYKIEEIIKFIENIKKIAKNFSFFIEPKIDGLSISIKYKNGKLFQALTRGNGLVGEDVTQNILQIENVPKNINYFEDLEVRGEVFLALDKFDALNKNLLAQNKPAMANPRNAAAGTLRQLNPVIVKERQLSAFLYYVVLAEKHGLKTMEESFNFLKKLGFEITAESQKVHSLEDIENYIKEFKQKRKLLNYETDGIVIKLNELKYYEKLGTTSKFPHSAIAFKYEPDIASTLLKDIFITVGRTGLITYNASLEEVEISGTKVAFATLNNFQFISDLGINIGDEVYIQKAGEIIPCVIGIANKNNLEPFNYFKNCPYCNSELVFNETFLEQYCNNENCSEIKIKKLIHFASKEGLDINTLGEKNIITFNKLGFIKNVEDIFKLKDQEDELIKIEGFGKLSISKMLFSIEESKTKSLDKLIFGLSIPLIGAKTAKFVASKLKKFENALTFDFSIFSSYHEFGSKITNNLIDWFSNLENQELIKNLISLGLNPEYKESKISNKLENLSFVITGKLSKPRNYFEKLIISHGGQVISSISSTTKYLLAGEDAGSKLSKAKKFSIKVIDENEFYELINE
ncbi:NAD-dependent DNA ligase LigA [Mycoplasma enhydrae]|uniref:NAD-dependent DNA ligase LigA n=1 Tax=Mycoplasma enhydrae TaxID=2499220 RepID=UPI0021E91699|nr:NAD-dependent DNA ligase LigA [Mycoplasma enhydrae]MCV3733669.1 NAD-dependent DNA ligase LigA [Mycoplasma enhydrae]